MKIQIWIYGIKDMDEVDLVTHQYVNCYKLFQIKLLWIKIWIKIWYLENIFKLIFYVWKYIIKLKI